MSHATLPANGFHALKEGDSFLVCDARGDIGGGSDGLFRDDTRVLSRLHLRLGGTEPSLLSAAVGQDNVTFTAHLTNRPLTPLGESSMAQGVLHIERSRFLWQARLYERIACVNYGEEEVRTLLQLGFAADFRDMFEVRGSQRAARGEQHEAELGERHVALRYRGLDGHLRSSVLAFSERPARLAADAAEFALTVPRGGRVEFYIEVGETPERPGRSRHRHAAARARWAMRARQRSGARVRTSARLFNAWLERSRADIALLVTELPSGPYPYAGIPWFSTAFGRDAIVTAMQTLWLDPRIARGVLGFLAENQARETSTFRDAAPGKIMHETRKGEMAALSELPFARYYGGVDTTPLFLMLAGAYAERTGDMALIDRLWPALLAAMQWIERSCDADPDGCLSYARGEASGLANQGWKDSEDSVFHADGSDAEGPIALVEVQGYVFAALHAMAALAERRGEGDAATRWRARASALRAVVEHRFWDEALGFYAIARDGRGRMCRIRASNVGHLLASGLPDPERGARVVAHLRSVAFDGGWGVRTVAADQARFNPMSYHNGSVWPHDVAFCAAGLARYGARDAALRLLEETFEAAVHFGMRLPELFCGFPRAPGEPPIAYPVACLPQAWAAGSVFLLLQAALGVHVDAAAGEVVVDRPLLPAGVDRLLLQGLDIGGTRLDIEFQRMGDRVVAARCGDGHGAVKVVARL
ncbi:glycogen debranching N-terminal domain-containing protein [Coralloluteibacterium thermophilus]|uniref:Glycogen debranching N-terminal domain-containing protein n=1 Tax=Coralloluteibacterium thermophilum TaxID=2707049 RepID=A0ABV9NLJ2_9GAMM